MTHRSCASAWVTDEFAIAEGDDFALHPELSKPVDIPLRGGPEKLGGRWPEAPWILFGYANDAAPVPELFDMAYRFREGRWKVVSKSVLQMK